MRPSKFVFYLEWLRTMDAAELTKAERSRLIDAIVAYADTGEAQDLPRLLTAIFAPIKATLDRDADKYERKAAVNRENGARGGRPRKPTETQENPLGYCGNPPKPTETHSCNNINTNTNINILNPAQPSEWEEKRIIYEIFFWRNFVDPQTELDRFVEYNAQRKWKALDTPDKRFAAAKEWQPQDSKPRVRKEFLDMWYKLYRRCKEEGNGYEMSMIDCGARMEFQSGVAKLRSRSPSFRKYIEETRPPEIMGYIGDLRLTTAAP